MLKTVLKNILVLGALAGGYIAVETGYFSHDRTIRSDWSEMDRLKDKGKPVSVYDADFSKAAIDRRPVPGGFWDYYNGAGPDTVAIENGQLVLKYTNAWIGSEFRHIGYKAAGVYRITFEAKVEGEPAAILMRNRQLDLMRERIPVTNGDFKMIQHHYVAPRGSMDQVRLIFMPDNPDKPTGKMTVRKFKIERLEG